MLEYPSWMTFLLVVAAGNAFILFDIGNMLFYQRRKEYTWLNKDFPIIMPIGDIPTVEMTFQESLRFGLSDPESKLNWGTLFNTNSFGLGVQHLGPYHFRYVTSAYHSLHCLYTVQKDLDEPDHVGNPSFHFNHCMSYLRQIFLCNADVTMENGDFLMRNFTTDRIGTTRKCRDWLKVSEWVNENNKEWARYNGVSLD